MKTENILAVAMVAAAGFLIWKAKGGGKVAPLASLVTARRAPSEPIYTPGAGYSPAFRADPFAAGGGGSILGTF